MPATLIAFALLSLVRPSIDVSVDASNGDVISAVHEFHVTVGDSKGIVTQVEFYVNHDLRDTVTSIPYNFKLDTVNEDDGNLDLEFRAYTTEGETGKKALTVKVDNQVSKGPEFHTSKAEDLVSNSKFDDGIIEARIALKAKPGYNPARMVMARAYLGKGSYDRAEKFIEDVLAGEPDNKAALQLLSAININQAFSTYSRGDSAEAQASIQAALEKGVGVLVKLQDSELDSFAVTPSNVKAYADLAIKYGRLSSAISKLMPAFREDPTRTEIGNRLAYAQIRDGRLSDAFATLADLKRRDKYDAYSYALEAVIDAILGNNDDSDAAMREAVLNDGDNLGVLTSEAFLALRKKRMDVFSQFVTRLNATNGQQPIVRLYVNALLNQQGHYEEARSVFLDLVKQDPTNADIYVQEANWAMQLGQFGKLGPEESQREYVVAHTLFNTALVARPESPEALTGLAISNLFLNKTDDAIRFAKAATDSSNSYAPAYYALSGAYKAAGNIDAAFSAMATAGKLDQRRLEGRQLPKPKDVWTYFVGDGKVPLIAAPGL